MSLEGVGPERAAELIREWNELLEAKPYLRDCSAEELRAVLPRHLHPVLDAVIEIMVSEMVRTFLYGSSEGEPAGILGKSILEPDPPSIVIDELRADHFITQPRRN